MTKPPATHQAVFMDDKGSIVDKDKATVVRVFGIDENGKRFEIYGNIGEDKRQTK